VPLQLLQPGATEAARAKVEVWRLKLRPTAAGATGFSGVIVRILGWDRWVLLGGFQWPRR
jgi:hypothetical protein